MTALEMLSQETSTGT